MEYLLSRRACLQERGQWQAPTRPWRADSSSCRSEDPRPVLPAAQPAPDVERSGLHTVTAHSRKTSMK